jgi:hypothetical protein
MKAIERARKYSEENLALLRAAVKNLVPADEMAS